MTYRSAVKRAKKAAKDHPGESYYVVKDEGYEVLSEWELTFEVERSAHYGDRVVAWLLWDDSAYSIEEYGFVEYQAA